MISHLVCLILLKDVLNEDVLDCLLSHQEVPVPLNGSDSLTGSAETRNMIRKVVNKNEAITKRSLESLSTSRQRCILTGSYSPITG